MNNEAKFNSDKNKYVVVFDGEKKELTRQDALDFHETLTEKAKEMASFQNDFASLLKSTTPLNL